MQVNDGSRPRSWYQLAAKPESGAAPRISLARNVLLVERQLVSSHRDPCMVHVAGMVAAARLVVEGSTFRVAWRICAWVPSVVEV